MIDVLKGLSAGAMPPSPTNVMGVSNICLEGEGGGGGGEKYIAADSWRFGRFAIYEQTDEYGFKSYSFVNRYYMVGGKQYALSDSVVPETVDYTIALVVNAKDASDAHLQEFGSMDDIVRASSDLDSYIFPLYTIHTDYSASEGLTLTVLADWRFGPIVMMAEF